MRTSGKWLSAAAPALLLVACTASAPESTQTTGDPLSLGGIGVIRGGGGRIFPGPFLADGTFGLHGVGNRCVDFGGQAYWGLGAPVYIYGCNGSVAQQIRIREIDTTHDVELRVQSLYCIGVRGKIVVPGQPLELQTCDGSPSQRFALDGDAILVGAQSSGRAWRDYVIEAQGAATANRTPLVVGTRDVDDTEYFRARAVDGSAAYPTVGFVRVTSEAELDAALTRGWGTVIEIDDQSSLVITELTSKAVHEGTTIRGYRKYTYQGPEIAFPTLADKGFPIFDVQEDRVRVTGLRLRGPSRSTDESSQYFYGVRAHDGHDILVDHIDGSDWTGSVVDVVGTDDENAEAVAPVCPAAPPPSPRPISVRVIGSFLHHNEREGGGYGVSTGSGAFVLAQGNVASMNRHAITADPLGLTGYVAYDNMVLSDSPSYGFLGHDHEQDFDKHGGNYDGGHWTGGISDDYADIGWNTFLGTNRHNFDERGTPCRFTRVHENVFLQTGDAAIHSDTSDASRDVIYGNVEGVNDPTSDLAVGDFDGDGVDDVFLGTGAAWYFSSGGVAEWRILSRKSEHASALRFGDFDGDGRTDVVTANGASLQVSWAGVSPWQNLLTYAGALTDIAVGDFDGDRYSDIFFANGFEWFYASAGRTWSHFAYSSFRTRDLLFADFTADKKTDVFSVVDGQWMIVPGGGDAWEPLRTALTSTVYGLVAADFDGDGFADIARSSDGAWQYAARGWGGFVALRSASEDISTSVVGRFNGDAKTDVLVWDGLHFDIAPGARDPQTTWSRQDAR